MLSLLVILSFTAPSHINSSSRSSCKTAAQASLMLMLVLIALLSISIRLLALKPIILLPLHHPTIDNDPRLCLFWLHDAIVCHAPAIFATVVCQPLLAPYVCFCFPFDLDLIWFVVSPEGAVATADGAEAFVGGFAEGWKGDADGFAVAGYLELGLLGGIGCHGGGGLWQVGKVYRRLVSK